jgi:hypothetical protein
MAPEAPLSPLKIHPVQWHQAADGSLYAETERVRLEVHRCGSGWNYTIAPKATGKVERYPARPTAQMAAWAAEYEWGRP